LWYLRDFFASDSATLCKKTTFVRFLPSIFERALLFRRSSHFSTRNTANRLKQAFPTCPTKREPQISKKVPIPAEYIRKAIIKDYFSQASPQAEMLKLSSPPYDELATDLRDIKSQVIRRSRR